MRKKISEQSKVIIVLLFISFIIMAIMTPLITSRSSHSYQNDLMLVETQPEVYCASQSLFDEELIVAQLHYIEALKTKSTESDVIRSIFKNGGRFKEETVKKISKALKWLRAEYNLMNYTDYYITIRDEDVSYGNLNLKGFLKDDYPQLNYKMDWYVAYSLDKDGKAQTIHTSTSYNVETKYNQFVDEFESMLERETNLTLELEPIKNTSFVMGLTQENLNTNVNIGDVRLSDYVSPIEGYYRANFMGFYSLVAVVLFIVTLMLPIKKIQETQTVKKHTTKRWFFLVLLLLFVDVTIANTVIPSVLAYLTLSSLILYIISLLVLLAPIIWFGLLIKSVLFQHKQDDDKEENMLVYHALYSVITGIQKLRTSITKIDFSKKRSRKLILWSIGNTVIVLVILLLAMSVPNSNMVVILASGLILYTTGFYCVIQMPMRKIFKNYDVLNDIIVKTAKGESDGDIVEDLGMFNSMKETLEHLQIDFKTAVEQEVQSQKMKTELITNVSHDLKTPLTSIISYIDLLKDEHTSEEDRVKYLSILEHSSDRLKHLIENLFEISKANSGNANIERMDVDIVSLLKQVEVECDTQFVKKQLDIRNKFQEEKIIISLDSQKTFRIFENLLGNVGKYAMEHTRVFVDVQDLGNQVEICIKNVSATELNFDPDEIMERFTRGDASRNSEGSGLGLAIAKSFTELQDGRMKIVIDGDLFKVILRFYRTEEI